MSKSSTPQRRVITINMQKLRTRHIVGLAVLAALIFFGALAFWAKHVYTSPQDTFEGMLARNLSTRSVTKEVTSNQEGETVEQYTQMSFVSEPTARSIVVLRQKNEGGKESVVKTETLGTRSADYSRYVKIDATIGESGKTPNFTDILGVWGKADATDGQTQYLQQAALGLVPFGNLRPEARADILTQIQERKIYSVDYSKAKSVKVDGKPAWEYTVSVNIAEYVRLLGTLSKEIGVEVSGLDPSAYENSPPATVTMSVGKYSRQLLELTTEDGQKEVYTAYGLSLPIDIPEKTIPISELQQKLQSVQ